VDRRTLFRTPQTGRYTNARRSCKPPVLGITATPTGWIGTASMPADRGGLTGRRVLFQIERRDGASSVSP
jgi:hypothetical protein